MNVLPGLIEWVLSQKRITNKRLRDRFDLTEEEADDIYYNFLKPIKIVSGMGHVNKEWSDNKLLCVRAVKSAYRVFRPSDPQNSVAHYDTLEEAIRDIKARGFDAIYEENGYTIVEHPRTGV